MYLQESLASGRLAADSIRILANRTSVRRFRRRKLSKRLIETIVEAGQRAPSACNLQPYSFVFVDSQKVRARIFKAIGSQRSMREAPAWIIACLDFARPMKLFKMLNMSIQLGRMCRLFSGIVDTCLATQNIVSAAEAFGVGSVFVGSLLRAPEKIAWILRLPAGVMPILLVCLGYPREAPPLRPRWPVHAVLHVNRYLMPSKQIMREYYRRGNAELLSMNYFRRGVNSWSLHWRSKFESRKAEMWERNLDRALRSFGFLQ